MLHPRYLAGLSDELVDLYAQLEADILADMARRIARLGRITDPTKWQAAMFAEAGGIKAHVKRVLARYDARIVAQVERCVTDAFEKSIAIDNRVFEAAGAGRITSESHAQAMLSTIQKCHSDLSRITLTTAHTSENAFVQEANRVYIDVQSGAFDYNSALHSATDALADRGVTTVYYENTKPVVRTIEAAVRMNILTSVNQSAANMTLNNIEQLNSIDPDAPPCDLVEVSAHNGARPEHEAWQGQVYSISGTHPDYPPFSICKLGEPTGICGINCRHSFYPYFEGASKHYTPDELDELAQETVTYTDSKGKTGTMTRYEGEQYQRHIERQIRKYKRRAVCEEAAGLDSSASRKKIAQWQAHARDFTGQTGLVRQSDRERIGVPKGAGQPTKKASNAPVLFDKQPSIVTFGNQTMTKKKFTGYALDHTKDRDKALAFERSLGYTKDNADVLIVRIKQATDESKFVEKGDKGHGMRYEQVIEIEGINGKKANVLTAWIDEGSGKKRLITVYVTDKKAMK